ncbi:MAG: ABC transporter ATP-binding protein, partial [Phycisphaerales bacterium]
EVLDAMMSTLGDETRSILFSSHNTQDVEQISDYITFLYGGQVIDSSDKEAFMDGWRRLRLTNPDSRRLPELGNIRDVRQAGRLCAVTVTNYDESIPSRFAAAGLTVDAVEALTLEEIFLSTVSYAKNAQATESAT